MVKLGFWTNLNVYNYFFGEVHRNFQVIVEKYWKTSSQSSGFYIFWSMRIEANSFWSPKSCCMTKPLPLILLAKTYINLRANLFMFLWAWYSKRRNYQCWPLFKYTLICKTCTCRSFYKTGLLKSHWITAPEKKCHLYLLHKLSLDTNL